MTTDRDASEITDSGFPVLKLTGILDFPASIEVFDMLRDRVDEGVVMDASGVRHLGAPCVQVLLCAARSWGASGVPFAVENRSEAFQQGLERLGIDADELPGSGVSGSAPGSASGPAPELASGLGIVSQVPGWLP